METILPADFASALSRWPHPARLRFLAMRDIILAAGLDAGTGPITESLKWGEPAWRPQKARIGSTLRLSWSEKFPELITLYVNCQTTLCTDIDRACPEAFILHGNRGLSHRIAAPLPGAAVSTCAEMTLTYFRSPQPA